jgi:hypothetical protein
MPGDSYSASSSETDASALSSGNVGNTSSADRISSQFINLGGSGTSALDLNSYLGAASAGFYNSIAGEQNLESRILGKPASNTFKYVALGSAVLISLIAVFAMRGRK